ncbi:MAG: TraR/DksA C4-type zinc finger protein [Planctomycetota bacterium]|jgi:RNA polymerase-binding protein DksA|nr:TraR/DksA C4-type zinc finger protein [Planctomycetota bacterium]
MPARKIAKKTINEFRKMLIAKRQILSGDVNCMEDQALKGNLANSAGELSHTPLHLADRGTDNYEQDFTLSLIESAEDEMRKINEALDRISDGSFGICEPCGNSIPLERLRVIPHTTHCVACQAKIEEEEGLW